MRASFDVLEQERRPARLDHAVGDLEIWIDLGGDAMKLTLALEQRDPRAEVFGRGQGALSL